MPKITVYRTNTAFNLQLIDPVEANTVTAVKVKINRTWRQKKSHAANYFDTWEEARIHLQNESDVRFLNAKNDLAAAIEHRNATYALVKPELVEKSK
jgi:hypothetical protein